MTFQTDKDYLESCPELETFKDDPMAKYGEILHLDVYGIHIDEIKSTEFALLEPKEIMYLLKKRNDMLEEMGREPMYDKVFHGLARLYGYKTNRQLHQDWFKYFPEEG